MQTLLLWLEFFQKREPKVKRDSLLPDRPVMPYVFYDNPKEMLDAMKLEGYVTTLLTYADM